MHHPGRGAGDAKASAWQKAVESVKGEGNIAVRNFLRPLRIAGPPLFLAWGSRVSLERKACIIRKSAMEWCIANASQTSAWIAATVDSCQRALDGKIHPAKGLGYLEFHGSEWQCCRTTYCMCSTH